MAIETALRVQLPNRPGEFARVTRQLADAGVSIRTVAGVVSGGEGAIEFLVDDTAAASRALSQGGARFQEVRVVVAPIPEQAVNQPGTIARMAEGLAAAGINIESLYAMVGPGGQVQAVLGCSDPDKAEQLATSGGA